MIKKLVKVLSLLAAIGAGERLAAEAIWEISLGEEVHAAPVMDREGNFYVGTLEGNVFSLDPDGNIRWVIETGDAIYGSMAINSGGTVYVGAGNSGIYALQSGSGEKIWEYQAEGTVRAPVRLNDQGDVLTGDDDGYLYSLNGVTGALNWRFQVGGIIRAGVVFGEDGTVLVGSYDRRVYAVDGETGEKKWDYKCSAWVGVDGLIMPGNELYVVDVEGEVYLLDARNGEKKWGVAPLGKTKAAPLVGMNGEIIISTESGLIHGIKAFSDRPIWSADVRGTILGTPVIGNDGEFYVSSMSGKVYRVELETNEVVGQVEGYGSLPASPILLSSSAEMIISSKEGNITKLAVVNTETKKESLPTGDDKLYDANLDKVKLSLAFNEIHGAVTATDVSTSGHVPVFNGNAKISDERPRFGGTSSYFDGNGDYLVLPDSEDWNFGTGDFTIEFWVLRTGVSKYEGILGENAESWNSGVPVIVIFDTKILITEGEFDKKTQASTSFNPNTWYHVAFSRGGGFMRLFVNGKLEGFAADTYEYDFNEMRIGRYNVGTDYDFGGYLDDLRITKGAARYTSNFDPPVTIMSDAMTLKWEKEIRQNKGITPSEAEVSDSSDEGGSFSFTDSTVYSPSEGGSFSFTGSTFSTTGASAWTTFTPDEEGSGNFDFDAVLAIYKVGSGSGWDAINEFTDGGDNDYRVWSSPAIGSDGTVYVATGKRVYARDGETGEKKWEYQTGGVKKWEYETYGEVTSSPAIGVDGIVYVGSNDNKVYALDGQTGVKQWEYETYGEVTSSPAIGADGIVYVGSYDNKVYALDGQTGVKQWEYETRENVCSSPAIGVDGIVYVGSNDNKIYALDGQTGVKKWEYLTGGKVTSSPAIGIDGTVYVGSNDNKVYAFDGQTGVKKWEYLTGGKVISSPAIGVDGTVYVGSNDNKIHALDGQTGVKKWGYLTGGKVTSSPAIGIDGTVYVGSNDNKIYALDGQTGVKKWGYLTGGDLNSSPMIGSDGTIYVGSEDGKMHAIATKSDGWALSAWPMFGSNPQRRYSGFKDRVFIKGKTAVIGYPSMADWELRWKKDGELLQPDDRISGVDQAYLRIADFNEEDTGRYSVLIDDGLRRYESVNIVVSFGYSLAIKVIPSTKVGRLRIKEGGDGSGVYVLGEKVVLEAVVNEGEQFLGWGGAEGSVDSELTLIMDGNKSVIAEFSSSWNRKWKYKTDVGNIKLMKYLKSSLAIGNDGTVYVGVGKGVYARNGETGEKKWEYQTGGEVLSSPAIGLDGTVYVGSNDKKVHAIDGETGEKKWEYETGGDVMSSPAIGLDGTVYVGSNDKKVHALIGRFNKNTKEWEVFNKWEYQTGGEVRSTPAIGLDGTVYVGSNDMKLYAINGETGGKEMGI